MRIGEHLPGDEITLGVALVKRRVADHEVDGAWRLVLEAVGPKELSFRCLEKAPVIRLSALDRHV